MMKVFNTRELTEALISKANDEILLTNDNSLFNTLYKLNPFSFRTTASDLDEIVGGLGLDKGTQILFKKNDEGIYEIYEYNNGNIGQQISKEKLCSIGYSGISDTVSSVNSQFGGAKRKRSGGGGFATRGAGAGRFSDLTSTEIKVALNPNLILEKINDIRYTYGYSNLEKLIDDINSNLDIKKDNYKPKEMFSECKNYNFLNKELIDILNRIENMINNIKNADAQNLNLESSIIDNIALGATTVINDLNKKTEKESIDDISYSEHTFPKSTKEKISNSKSDLIKDQEETSSNVNSINDNLKKETLVNNDTNNDLNNNITNTNTNTNDLNNDIINTNTNDLNNDIINDNNINSNLINNVDDNIYNDLLKEKLFIISGFLTKENIINGDYEKYNQVFLENGKYIIYDCLYDDNNNLIAIKIDDKTDKWVLVNSNTLNNSTVIFSKELGVLDMFLDSDVYDKDMKVVDHINSGKYLVYDIKYGLDGKILAVKISFDQDKWVYVDSNEVGNFLEFKQRGFLVYDNQNLIVSNSDKVVIGSLENGNYQIYDFKYDDLGNIIAIKISKEEDKWIYLEQNDLNFDLISSPIVVKDTFNIDKTGSKVSFFNKKTITGILGVLLLSAGTAFYIKYKKSKNKEKASANSYNIYDSYTDSDGNTSFCVSNDSDDEAWIDVGNYIKNSEDEV